MVYLFYAKEYFSQQLTDISSFTAIHMLLNFAGFGAPVPRTTAGRTVGVIFAAIGIPAHFLLILNFGLMAALRLQRYANARRNLRLDNADPNYSMPMPKWVKIVPFVCSGELFARL